MGSCGPLSDVPIWELLLSELEREGREILWIKVVFHVMSWWLAGWLGGWLAVHPPSLRWGWKYIIGLSSHHGARNSIVLFWFSTSGPYNYESLFCS